MWHKLRFPVMGTCACLLFASMGAAQSTFGSITGVVTDPTGSVVPKAQVSVTNAGTGVVRDTIAGSGGVFNVPNLDLGTLCPARKRTRVYNP